MALPENVPEAEVADGIEAASASLSLRLATLEARALPELTIRLVRQTRRNRPVHSRWQRRWPAPMSLNTRLKGFADGWRRYAPSCAY